MDQEASAARLTVASVATRTKAELGERPDEQRYSGARRKANARRAVTLDSMADAGKFALSEGWREEIRADLEAQIEARGTLYDFAEDGTCIERTKDGERLIPLSVTRGI